MGYAETLPSLTLGPKRATGSDVTFINMDPTIIIRLHSIISGADIFKLSRQYDYNVKEKSKKIISMDIPNDMVKRLRGLTNIEIENVLYTWKESKEVSLSAWSKSQTEVYLHSLISSCKKGATQIHILMHLDKHNRNHK